MIISNFLSNFVRTFMFNRKIFLIKAFLCLFYPMSDFTGLMRNWPFAEYFIRLFGALMALVHRQHVHYIKWKRYLMITRVFRGCCYNKFLVILFLEVMRKCRVLNCSNKKNLQYQFINLIRRSDAPPAKYFHIRMEI